MGFFKDITSGVSKAVSAVVKDAVPLAAAVATGGTSLAVLKPTNTLDRLDKLTGLPVAQLSSMYGPLGALSAGMGSMGGNAPQTTSAEVVQSILPQSIQQSANSIYDQITPYLNSFMQASQQKSNDVSPNANYLASQPVQQSSGGSSKMMLIIGGIVALAVGSFFFFKRKK